MKRVDGIAILVAILLHAGAVAGLRQASITPRAAKAAIEVEVRSPELPREGKIGAPGEAGTPAVPALKRAAQPRMPSTPRAPRPALPRLAQAPAPSAEAPPAAEAASAEPQYQFAMESPDSAEPGAAAGGGAGGSATSGTGTGGGGGGGTSREGIALRQLPSVDTDACGRYAAYTAEAQSLGIEGDVAVRVSLDEKGKVIAAKVLSGLGHGLDEAAATALKTRCVFTPAIDMNGNPVSYVIPRYVFRFRLP